MNYAALYKLVDASPNIQTKERDFLEQFLEAATADEDLYLQQPRMDVKASALAWVVRHGQDGLEALVHHHEKSGNIWPFGGGFEPEDKADPVKCALRELTEESGLPKDIITQLTPLTPQLLCLSIILEQSVASKKHGWLEFTTGWHWPDGLPARPVDMWINLHTLREKYTHDPFYLRIIDNTYALNL